MGLKNWGSKIAASEKDVLTCLKQLADSMNGTFSPCDESAETDEDNISIMITSNEDGSTSIGWYEAGMVPEVVLFLSKKLKTRIISVDQQENIGYQHFSELKNGKTVRLFTRCEAEEEPIRDLENIPDDYLIDIAKRKESKGVLSRVQKEPLLLAFDLLLAEHDMQLFPLEGLLDADDVKYYQLSVTGLGQRFLGSFESSEKPWGRYWGDLVK